MTNDEIPRRCRHDLHTPAEKAITAAMEAVEEAGCDVRLTQAVILLGEARERVADFVEGISLLNPADAVLTFQGEAMRGYETVQCSEVDAVTKLEARITRACALIEDTRRLVRTGRPVPNLVTLLDMYWAALSEEG